MKDSAGVTLYPRKLALQVGEQLVKLLRPVTERIEIVGSVRRKYRLVKDCELLFVPKIVDSKEDMFQETLIDITDQFIEGMLKDGILTQRHNSSGHPTWGKQNKLARHVKSDLPVDLFSVPKKNWFVSLVIRTGPKRLNLELIKSAHDLGLQLHAYGVFTRNGNDKEEIVPKSEREVFKLAGVPYLDPKDRK